MALAIQTELEVINYALCPAPANLQPGKYYRLTGLTQGSLGTYDVLAVANTATQFASDVKVFPVSAPTNDTGWAGILDFDTCQLTYLHDNKNNKVAGSVNISVFPWFPANPFRVAGNTIEASTTLNLGGNAYSGQFENNHVLTTSSITVSGAALTSTDLVINDNVWKRTSFSIAETINIRFHVTANNFLEANSVIVTAGNVGDVFINNNNFLNNAAVEVGSTGNIIFVDNTVNGAFVFLNPPLGVTHSIDGNIITHLGPFQTSNSSSGISVTDNWFGGPVVISTTGGTVSISKSVVGPSGEITLLAGGMDTGTIVINESVIHGVVLISSNEADISFSLSYSTILQGGAGLGVYDFQYVIEPGATSPHIINYLTMLAGSKLDISTDSGSGTITNVTLAQAGQLFNFGGTPGPQITNAYIENGGLDFAGFAADNIRLQGASSTLIAPVSDAKKDGYAGVLP